MSCFPTKHIREREVGESGDIETWNEGKREKEWDISPSRSLSRVAMATETHSHSQCISTCFMYSAACVKASIIHISFLYPDIVIVLQSQRQCLAQLLSKHSTLLRSRFLFIYPLKYVFPTRGLRQVGFKKVSTDLTSSLELSSGNMNFCKHSKISVSDHI